MTRLFFVIAIACLCLSCDNMSRDLKVKNLKGFEFSFRDVQEQCTVKREGDQGISVICESKRLRPVERSCVGQMTAGLRDPKFYCSGGLWVLNDKCYIEMVSTQKGNVRCKKD